MTVNGVLNVRMYDLAACCGGLVGSAATGRQQTGVWEHACQPRRRAAAPPPRAADRQDRPVCFD